jgi:malate/lactate dehydrogenase
VCLREVLGRGGVQRMIDIPLCEEEEEVLLESAEEIKKMIQAVESA